MKNVIFFNFDILIFLHKIYTAITIVDVGGTILWHLYLLFWLGWMHSTSLETILIVE